MNNSNNIIPASDDLHLMVWLEIIQFFYLFLKFHGWGCEGTRGCLSWLWCYCNAYSSVLGVIFAVDPGLVWTLHG